MTAVSSPQETDVKVKKRSPFLEAALPFIIGGSSGCVATCCIQPIDMVKVRIQLADSSSGVKPTPYRIAKAIVAQGRVLDLYSGISAALARQVVYGTSRLGLFFTFEDMLTKRAQSSGRKSINFGERALAGLAAGGLGAAIGNPTEVALIRMQSDGMLPAAQRANYRSVFDALARIVRNEGFTTLWSGAYPTIIRAMSTNFGQLAFFSESKHQLSQHTSLSEQNKSLAASAIAGFFASFFSLPFDFVKTRLQKQKRSPDGSLQYKGMFDCFVKVTKEEGVFRLYRGFTTYFFRLAPHTMITLVIADKLKLLVS